MSRKVQPNRSLGKMSASELFRSGLPSTRTRRQVVASFLKAAEGVAHRWIDTRKGTLLLQMAPYQPASGQIYIYDRQRDMWYLPLGFVMHGRCVREGFDSIEKLALFQAERGEVPRVAIHKKWEAGDTSHINAEQYDSLPDLVRDIRVAFSSSTP